MKVSACCCTMMSLASAFTLLLVAAAAAPMDTEDEQAVNSLVSHGDSNEVDMGAPWDTLDTAALRKLLLQLDNEDRFGLLGARVGRAWPQAEPRSWGPRSGQLDSRLARQWRADKRQVRFRQCYFNPISCFRK